MRSLAATERTDEGDIGAHVQLRRNAALDDVDILALG